MLLEIFTQFFAHAAEKPNTIPHFFTDAAEICTLFRMHPHRMEHFPYPYLWSTIPHEFHTVWDMKKPWYPLLSHNNDRLER
jgi:hypothetical protein